MKRLFIILAAFVLAFAASFLLDVPSISGNVVRYALVVLLIIVILWLGWLMFRAADEGDDNGGVV